MLTLLTAVVKAVGTIVVMVVGKVVVIEVECWRERNLNLEQVRSLRSLPFLTLESCCETLGDRLSHVETSCKSW